MIVMYPLIVSKTVNPNILPGVCKALEKYVYVNNTDGVIEAANQSIKKQQSKTNSYVTLKNIGNTLKFRLEHIESDKTIDDYITEDWSIDDWDDEFLTEKPKGSVQQVYNSDKTPKQNNDKPPKNKSEKRNSYKDNYQKPNISSSSSSKEIINEPPKIGKMDADSINTSPTWNTITDQQGETKAIGVKVIPFIIDNEQSLVKLMTIDRYRSKLSKNIQVQSRKILRFMHRLANATWKRTIGFMFSWTGFVDKDLQKGTVSKNWKNDIILQNTFFKQNMFVLLNKMDLEDDFTKSASGVKKLFKLGWTSFVIADDINKVVTFCMKDYRGMCSMVNYGFLYADARTQSQVYTDIEDIRKSAGPLFRMKRRKKSMITDSLAQYKLDKYSQDILISESVLNESLAPEIFKKLKDKPKSMVSDFKAISSAFKRKDYKKASMIASKKFNPSNKKLDVSKVIDKAIASSPEYKRNYNTAYRVFKNSLPKLDDKTLKMGSGLLASIASMNKNKKYNFKNDLKKVVINTRSKTKTLEEDNDAFASDLKVAFIFSIVALFIMGGGITISLYFLSVLLPVVGGVIFAVWPFIAGLIILIGALKLLAGVSEGGRGDDD